MESVMVKKPTKAERIEIMKNYTPTPEQIKRDIEAREDAIYKNEYYDVLTTEEALVKESEKNKRD